MSEKNDEARYKRLYGLIASTWWDFTSRGLFVNG
jgi:hypothetical protein